MTTHSKIVISCGALIVAMVAGRSAAPSAAEPNAAVQGVWRTLEVVVPGAAGRTFKPDATLAIFHGRHYSRVEVHAEQPRPLLGDPADASADQLRAVWGPFVAEAGTFEVSGSDVITMQRDGREESRGDARRSVERLHVPAPGRHVDTDPGPHACRSECTADHGHAHTRRVISAHINGDPVMTSSRRASLTRRPRASRRRDLSWRHADAPQ